MRFDLSVVVCCYNGSKTINKCLLSLLNQKLKKGNYIEVIVIDDGSTDETKNIVIDFIEKNKTSNIEFKIISKLNEGLSKTRNLGIKLSKSQIISYIDEDAVASCDWAQKIISFFRTNKDVNSLGGSVKLLNKSNRIANLIYDSFIKFYFKTNNTIIGTNMAFKKSFLIENDGFQNEFTYRGDESAFIMKSKKNIKIYSSNKIVVFHQQPSSWLRWCKIRFENGYFGVAIDFLVEDFSSANKKLVYSSILYFFTVLFFFSFFIDTGWLNILIKSIFLIIFLKKFIFNKYLFELVLLLKTNKKYFLKDYITIVLMAVIGEYFKHFGFLNGFLIFKNKEWSKVNLDF